uniref:Uncharacterized protein n=1 Tax=Cucumis sativus TaxID=3659 RepID=A0A0A0LL15_CUCSA
MFYLLQIIHAVNSSLPKTHNSSASTLQYSQATSQMPNGPKLGFVITLKPQTWPILPALDLAWGSILEREERERCLDTSSIVHVHSSVMEMPRWILRSFSSNRCYFLSHCD